MIVKNQNQNHADVADNPNPSAVVTDPVIAVEEICAYRTNHYLEARSATLKRVAQP